MKIFIISTPWIALPPPGYGGTEKVVYNLTEGLVKKGHEVTVAATGDSKTSAKLTYLYQKNLGIATLLLRSHFFFFLNHIHAALKQVPPDTDIIHNHCEFAGMYLLDHSKIPFVHTLHNAFNAIKEDDQRGQDKTIDAVRETLQIFKHQQFVSISNAQRVGMPDLHYAETVYNGINMENFHFHETALSDHMSWLGRFSPLKGLDMAVQAAKLLHRKLKISPYINMSRQGLFDETIKPHVDHDVINVIEEIQNINQKSVFMGSSKLFLFPIQWEEPFGLVMIESMATGTPVVAFARGSVPEIVKDGETGFLVNPSDTDIRGDFIVKKAGIEGLCEAIERIYSMPIYQYQQMRQNCRVHVEAHFTVEKMVDQYEEVYEKILKTVTN